MEIFGSDPKTEINEITSDVLDLYNEIINCNPKEIGRESVVYEREYKKILHKLENHFNDDILGPGVPDFLDELLEEIQYDGWIPSHVTIMKTIEMGLKKIMKKLRIEIPEKSNIKNEEHKPTNSPQIHNILYANQSMNNQITINNELKIEIDNAVNEFINELNKSKPDTSKLEKILEVIKKGSGYGVIKIVDALLKKVFGI